MSERSLWAACTTGRRPPCPSWAGRTHGCPSTQNKPPGSALWSASAPSSARSSAECRWTPSDASPLWSWLWSWVWWPGRSYTSRRRCGTSTCPVSLPAWEEESSSPVYHCTLLKSLRCVCHIVLVDFYNDRKPDTRASLRTTTETSIPSVFNDKPLLRHSSPTIFLYLIMLSDDFDLVNSNFLVVFFEIASSNAPIPKILIILLYVFENTYK